MLRPGGAYGILLYCNTFSASEVRIITGNPLWLPGFPSCFTGPSACGSTGCRRRGRGGKLVFQITDGGKLRRIVDLLGFSPEQNLALHINFGLLEEECCRGVLPAGGVLRRGQRRGPGQAVPPGAGDLPPAGEPGAGGAAAGVRLSPQERGPQRQLITYFKQSDQIEDFLTLIGAPVAAMSVMSAKLEKDLRNSVNRRLNCDSANLDKAVEAAQEQLESIRKLQRAGLLDQLPDKLQLTAACGWRIRS